MTSNKIIFFGLVMLYLVGCAGIDVGPVDITNNESRAKSKGIRYYESSPFLLIHTDNAGGLTSKIIYLPDTTKLMSIRPYSYFASNNTTLKFEQGLLTQAKAVVDETIIPTAVISSLETVAKGIIEAANAPTDANQYTVPAPYLFRINLDNGKWELNGGQGVDQSGMVAKIRVSKAK